MYPFLNEKERCFIKIITLAVKMKLCLKMQIIKDCLYIKYIYYQKSDLSKVQYSRVLIFTSTIVQIFSDNKKRFRRFF